MTELFIIFVLLAETAAVVRVARTARLVLFPTLFLVYIIYCQLIYFLVVNGLIIDNFLSTYTIGGTQQNEIETHLFYAALFCFTCWIGRGINFSGGFREILSSSVFRKISYGAAAALGVYAIALCISLDWGVVWANNAYLMMTDPRGDLLRPNDLDILNLSLLLPTGILAACLAGANFGKKDYGPAALLGIYAAASSLYFLGAHQRGATVIALVFLCTTMVVARRQNLFVCAVVGSYAVYAYLIALAGRGSGFHGLSSIANGPELFASIDFERFFGDVLSNSAEGIFVFAETLSYPASYPLSYELLSFSPFPSAIDGFSSIRDLYQVRLHAYVPFSGYGEAIKFGPLFVILLAVCFIGIGRLNTLLVGRSPAAFIIVNALTFSGMLVLNSYPLRTGLRVIWVAYLVGLLSLAVSRRRHRSTPSRVMHRALPLFTSAKSYNERNEIY